MKRVIFIFLLNVIFFSASAFCSGLAFQTEKNSTMRVIINGKLCNTTAKSFVRVASNAGLFHVEIKVLNPYDKVWYVVRKDVTIEKGYDFYYKVDFQKGKRPVLTLVKRYPVFNRDYSNPFLINKPLLA
jgi:hypothetical protein